MLIGRGPVGPAEESRDADRGGGFGGNPQCLPQPGLRCPDRGVIDQDDAVDLALGNGKHQVADPPGGEGIRRDTARWGVGRLAVRAGAGEGRCAVRLYSDDADRAGEVGGHARDQAASAHRHQHGIQFSGLILEYVESRSRAELLDQVLDKELPRYAEALERLGQ